MTKSDSKVPAANRKRGVSGKATPERLRNIALRHLERFATSSEGLREVLRRRAIRSARRHDTDLSQAEAWIDEIIVRFEEIGLLNDKAFAEARAKSLHGRGLPARTIKLRLARKGVEAGDVDEALASLKTEHEEPEFEAAVIFARKRCLGPYRDSGNRRAMRQKDMAAMARTGFSHDMARTVIDAESVDALETRRREGVAGLSV